MRSWWNLFKNTLRHKFEFSKLLFWFYRILKKRTADWIPSRNIKLKRQNCPHNNIYRARKKLESYIWWIISTSKFQEQWGRYQKGQNYDGFFLIEKWFWGICLLPIRERSYCCYKIGVCGGEESESKLGPEEGKEYYGWLSLLTRCWGFR